MAAPLTTEQFKKADDVISAVRELLRSMTQPDAPASAATPPAAAATPAAVPEPRSAYEMRRFVRFLQTLEAAGGDVTPEHLSRLARENGYDPRGLGGFYTGDKPSLRSDESRDRRILTDEGRRNIERYKDEYGS